MTVLNDAHLLDYAAGNADPATALLAACAICMRPETAARFGAAETLGGLSLEDAPGCAMRPDAFNAVLAKAEAAGSSDEILGAVTSSRFPEPLERALAAERRGGALQWRKRPGGMSEIRLRGVSSAGVEARLIRLSAGGGVPAHDHEGDELTLVLEGAFSDEHGVYRHGDVCEAGPGLDHNPRVEGDQECICLIVRRGRWRFRNPIVGLLDRVLSLI